MTTHVDNILTHTVKATEGLAKFKLATIGGTIAQANSGFKLAGLIQTETGSGYHHGAVLIGIVKAYAGAAVTSLGWPAASANSGFLTNAASGGFTVGRFLETCNSGDLVQVALDCLNVGQILA
jgi:hypothetical protein